MTQQINYVARVWDQYGCEIESHYHHDRDMLENIVRGDWDGSDHAYSFTILTMTGNEIMHDTFR